MNYIGYKDYCTFNTFEEVLKRHCAQQLFECKFLVQKKAGDGKCCQRHDMTADF
jgi:hypothetical protein